MVFDRIRNGDGVCVLVEYAVAPIVLQCRPDVESILAAVVPRAGLLRIHEVPSISREVGCRSGEDGEKVVLEGANGPLCRIASVYIRWYQLERTVVGCDRSLECATDFVVKNVQHRRLSGSGETGVDIIVCSYPMTVVF